MWCLEYGFNKLSSEHMTFSLRQVPHDVDHSWHEPRDAYPRVVLPRLMRVLMGGMTAYLRPQRGKNEETCKGNKLQANPHPAKHENWGALHSQLIFSPRSSLLQKWASSHSCKNLQHTLHPWWPIIQVWSITKTTQNHVAMLAMQHSLKPPHEMQNRPLLARVSELHLDLKRPSMCFILESLLRTIASAWLYLRNNSDQNQILVTYSCGITSQNRLTICRSQAGIFHSSLPNEDSTTPQLGHPGARFTRSGASSIIPSIISTFWLLPHPHFCCLESALISLWICIYIYIYIHIHIIDAYIHMNICIYIYI